MKIIVCFIVFILTFNSLKAQTDSVYYGNLKRVDSLKQRREINRDLLEKFSYEGNLQFRMSAYTYIYLSPAIGYSPVEKLTVGLGVIYNYISINYGAPYGKVSQSVFGGHSFARYFFTDEFFVQGQFDRLRQPDVFGYNAEQKKWVDYTLAGAGFRKEIGEKIGLTGSFLYNLTPSRLSIYPSRLILQFGFLGRF